MAIIVLVVVAAVVLGIGYMMSGYTMGIHRQTLEEARAWQGAHYDLTFYDELPKEDFTVTCRDGYVLHAQYLRCPNDSGKMVILSHGYTDNRFGALKYARIYLDAGFSAVIYDLRGHGMNEPTFCTYSVRERLDLENLIREVQERYKPETLGLHGESLGAATTCAVLGLKPQVDFAVADCPFAEILPVLKGGLRGMHVPAFLVYPASLMARFRYGYGFGQMRPIQEMGDNEVPLLLIHGAEDNFILPEHSERLSERTRGYTELHFIPGAGHAMSVLTDEKEYRSIVNQFLDRVLGEEGEKQDV